MPMEFRVLGPLEVLRGRQALSIEAHKPRAVLALLLLHANEIVSRDRLIDDLWNGSAPAGARKTLQTYIWQLRKSIGQDRIVTRGPGYLVRVEPHELDLDRFESLRSSGTPHEALAVWRGDALVDFADEPWARQEITRLEEARLTTLEGRIDADLELGSHAELVGELDHLVAQHPLRERLRAQLMLALYRCGRQAEALQVYRDFRRTLIEELGLEPSVALQHLEQAILRQDGELDVPAAATTLPEPTRWLAPDERRFIGRVQEMADVLELLARDELVTLTGPGGVGKTRLALEVEGAEAPRRRDGAVFVELSSIREPELVAPTILRALGLPEPRTRSPADVLAGYLRRKELLLVLDNFEQVVSAAPLLAELRAASPRVAFLVTSRLALHLPGEKRYDVPPLDLPAAADDLAALADAESVALFVERAATSRPGFGLTADNAQVVAELCLRLDGLPLALELAAARINLLSPSAILSRLGKRLDLLKATEAGVPDRHTTLRAAIQWSYDLLDEEQRALFGSLAVFSGSFGFDAAEAVADEAGVVDGLAALIDASLVRTHDAVDDEPRFGMLETIRSYALERLTEREDHGELRRRHAAFYADLAEEAEPMLRGPRQNAWLARIDVDRENIRAALAWAEKAGEVEIGLRTAAALWRYWQFRGELGEPSTQLTKLLAGAEGIDPHVRAAGLSAAARTAYLHGDHESAQCLCQASLELHRALGEADASSFALTVLGLAAQGSGDDRQARASCEEALALARAAGDWWSVLCALTSLGDVLYAQGELPAARRCLEEAIRAAREIGDTRSVARTAMALAAVVLEQGSHARATQLLEEALAIARELGDRWGIARALTSLGMVEREAGHDARARSLVEEGLAVQLEADDRPGVAASIECLAALAADRGRFEHAASLYSAAGILREMIGSSPTQYRLRDREETIEAVVAALDQERFADAWSRGRSMTLDEVVVYARGTDVEALAVEGS